MKRFRKTRIIIEKEQINPKILPRITRIVNSCSIELIFDILVKTLFRMPNCPRCSKPVYFAERVTSLGKDWHRPCLKCEKCGKVSETVTVRGDGNCATGRRNAGQRWPLYFRPWMLVVILNMTRGHTVTDHAMLLYLDQKDLDEVVQSHMFIINFMALKFTF